MSNLDAENVPLQFMIAEVEIRHIGDISCTIKKGLLNNGIG